MSHRRHVSLAATLLVVLVPACAAGQVDGPPAPPAYEPGAGKPAPREEPRPPRAEEARPAAESAAPAPVASVPAQEAAPKPAAQEGAPAAKAEPPAREDTPLGWIAGKPLEPEELLVEWGDVSSRELWLVLDKIVAARLAMAEASRLGIRLDPEAVELRYDREREKLRRSIAREGSEERSLEDFVRRELGFEPARYLDRVRRATIRQMLAERAVRASSLAGESVALRLIVVPAEKVEAVTAALASGRPFEEVAAELSIDDSRDVGGLVPFVVPQERSPLARLAFQTAVGETAGPLPVGEHRFWIRVEQRRAPLEGDWTVVQDAVESSLETHPVADAEFVHWKLAMEGRYPIDLGPMWSLIGAAR